MMNYPQAKEPYYVQVYDKTKKRWVNDNWLSVYSHAFKCYQQKAERHNRMLDVRLYDNLYDKVIIQSGPMHRASLVAPKKEKNVFKLVALRDLFGSANQHKVA